MPIRKFIVSRDDTIYEAWPDVVLLPSGKLVCVFMDCTHHADRSYTCVMVTESTDRGRTWRPKRLLSEPTRGIYPTEGLEVWNCARIMLLQDGRVAVICDRLRCGRDGTYNQKELNYIWFSEDEGESWEGPHLTPMEGIVPDKLLELASGRWIISCHRLNSASQFCEQRLWYSDNKGKSWEGPVTIAAQKGLDLCEVSILPLPDGTLVAFLRENSGQGWDCYKTISYDQGEHWEGPYRFPLPGCHRPVTGLLQSGKIMITYRFMQGGKRGFGFWTQNFFAALTDIESVKAKERNEACTRIMPVDFDRSPVSDLGYSGWVQFPDGEIYVVNYIVDDAPGKAYIRGYSFWEKDFLLESK